MDPKKETSRSSAPTGGADAPSAPSPAPEPPTATETLDPTQPGTFIQETRLRPSAAPTENPVDPDLPPMPTPEQLAGVAAGTEVSQKIPVSDEPGELGFIQAGFVYYDSAAPPARRAYTYVERIVGDGGCRNAQTRENHLKLRILGSLEDGSADRLSTRHRRALAREVDTRVLHQDLEYPLGVTAHEQQEALASGPSEQQIQRGRVMKGYNPTRPSGSA